MPKVNNFQIVKNSQNLATLYCSHHSRLLLIKVGNKQSYLLCLGGTGKRSPLRLVKPGFSDVKNSMLKSYQPKHQPIYQFWLRYIHRLVQIYLDVDKRTLFIHTQHRFLWSEVVKNQKLNFHPFNDRSFNVKYALGGGDDHSIMS